MMKLSNHKTERAQQTKIWREQRKIARRQQELDAERARAERDQTAAMAYDDQQATKDGRTVDRLSAADSFDARLPAEGQSDGRVVYRTIDSKSPPG